MVEIVSFFKLCEKYEKESIRSFHLAEGPGGFIEALVNIRLTQGQNEISGYSSDISRQDTYVGMTILTDADDPNIPAWKKSTQFLKNNPNVLIETGQDKTGNILSLSNYDYCVDNYGSKMDIITGDGGFNFSEDFNNQESNMGTLLFGQAIYAISMQKRGGSFILKMFDCFTKTTVDIIALLASLYRNVYITKPQSSRYANSEKYIVCKDFLLEDTSDLLPVLRKTFETILNRSTTSTTGFDLFESNPAVFINKMEEYNAIFGQQQIENIHYTISIIEMKHKTDKIEYLNRQNIQKCIQWCIRYNVEYNKMTNNTNMFTHVDNIFNRDPSRFSIPESPNIIL
jgi:23S rRNA U2552 (ribose-2'-O)-methylase RlmE/FtsJ